MKGERKRESEGAITQTNFVTARSLDDRDARIVAHQLVNIEIRRVELHTIDEISAVVDAKASFARVCVRLGPSRTLQGEPSRSTSPENLGER